MTEPAQPLDLNAPYYVHIVEEIVELFILSDTPACNFVARDNRLLRPPIGQSNSTFDLQSDINFTGNGGAKVDELIHNIEGIVTGRNLISDLLSFFFFSF